MKIQKRTGIASAIAFTGLSMGLSGCSVIDAVYGPERMRSLKGDRLSELKLVHDLTVQNGQLIISYGGEPSRGIAYIDTSADTVTRFVPFPTQPWQFVFASPEELYVTLHRDVPVIDVFDVVSGRLRPGFPTNFGGASFRPAVSGGQPFLIDTWDGTLYRITRTAQALGITVHASGLEWPVSMALSGRDTYVATWSPGWITVLDSSRSWAARDSIDVGLGDTTARAHSVWNSVHAFGNRIFVIVNLRDTSYVTVLDTETRAVAGTIPLAFKGVKSAGVHNGYWYLFGTGLDQNTAGNPLGGDAGGIERIVLATEEHGGIVASETTLGETILDFVPAGDGFGYFIYFMEHGTGQTPIRKVRY